MRKWHKFDELLLTLTGVNRTIYARPPRRLFLMKSFLLQETSSGIGTYSGLLHLSIGIEINLEEKIMLTVN